MSSEIAIKVENLSKCYHLYDQPRDRLRQMIVPRLQRMIGQPPRQYFREFWALKDVSFEIRQGETVGIIGRNGSGKSTLLQLICGTLNPTNGSIQTNGRVAALLELGSGFNPEFTGRENVYMNAAVLGLNHEETDCRFEDIVAFADIGDFIEQPVKTYSSGMVVRLAFSVIVHVNADILVIDEALSVGDAFFVQKCMRFLRKFMEEGTVLFVSHDTGAVLNLCESVVWLQEGVVVAKGEPKKITEHYLEKLYESQQGTSILRNTQKPGRKNDKGKPPRDMRLDFINQSNLRNDIELFQFSSEAKGFGKSGAAITNVQLLDETGNLLAWVVGGELVKLEVHCVASQSIMNPIVGFQVKDRLGQVVFADNTYLSYSNHPFPISKVGGFKACFDFYMPLLPIGDYTIAVAVAEGTQNEHIQHHWIHDALSFKVHSTSVCHGLIGVPMMSITLRKA